MLYNTAIKAVKRAQQDGQRGQYSIDYYLALALMEAYDQGFRDACISVERAILQERRISSGTGSAPVQMAADSPRALAIAALLALIRQQPEPIT